MKFDKEIFFIKSAYFFFTSA